jgi:hypothetical protein
LFKDDATFCQRPGLANPALVSFESYNYPGYYLRHQDTHLYIDNGQRNGAGFKSDATFEWVMPVPPPPIFFIVNVRSGKCVDVEGRPGLFDKNKIQLFDCESSTDPNTDQIWEFVNGGFLQNVRSGRCLDVDGNPGIDDQDRVELFTCEFTVPNTDQKWEFVNGGFLKNLYSGKCLDVEGYPGEKNQSPLQLFTCEGATDPNTDQIWMLTQIK